jgi:hypothetical protein
MNLPFGDGFVPLIYCDFGDGLWHWVYHIGHFSPSPMFDMSGWTVLSFWGDLCGFFSHFPTKRSVDTVQEKWVHDFLSLDSVQIANMCWFGMPWPSETTTPAQHLAAYHTSPTSAPESHLRADRICPFPQWSSDWSCVKHPVCFLRIWLVIRYKMLYI